MRVISALGLLALLAAPAHAASQKTAVAVLDLKDNGVGAATAQNLTDVVTASIAGLGVFDVLSRADIQQMVQFEQDRQLLGCDGDTTCLAELGGALGVALLVTGSIGKVADTYILNLSLTDARAGRVLARDQRKIERAAELTSEAESAARFIVRELLEGRQGFLILKTDEAGADVEVDGRLVGATPLARQSLAAGPHRVRVVKKGFIVWQRDLSVEPGEPLVLDAQLVPSLEFIEEYESRADTWRLLAYVSGGAGATALVGGMAAYFGYNADRAARFNREVTAAGCDAGGAGRPTIDCQARFADRRDSIETVDTVSVVSMLVGAAALGAGAFLYTQGPEPGLYDQYKPEATVTTTVGVMPTPGGLLGGLALGF